MTNKTVRKEVGKILKEVFQQLHTASPLDIGNNFPYLSQDDIVRLPQDIDTKEEYLVNWEEVSDNHDIYNFPMDEFIKGIQVEKAKSSIFNILDISKIVINNLEENPHFYSNLGV